MAAAAPAGIDPGQQGRAFWRSTPVGVHRLTAISTHSARRRNCAVSTARPATGCTTPGTRSRCCARWSMTGPDCLTREPISSAGMPRGAILCHRGSVGGQFRRPGGRGKNERDERERSGSETGCGGAEDREGQKTEVAAAPRRTPIREVPPVQRNSRGPRRCAVRGCPPIPVRCSDPSPSQRKTFFQEVYCPSREVRAASSGMKVVRWRWEHHPPTAAANTRSRGLARSTPR